MQRTHSPALPAQLSCFARCIHCGTERYWNGAMTSNEPIPKCKHEPNLPGSIDPGPRSASSGGRSQPSFVQPALGKSMLSSPWPQDGFYLHSIGCVSPAKLNTHGGSSGTQERGHSLQVAPKARRVYSQPQAYYLSGCSLMTEELNIYWKWIKLSKGQ